MPEFFFPLLQGIAFYFASRIGSAIDKAVIKRRQ